MEETAQLKSTIELLQRQVVQLQNECTFLRKALDEEIQARKADFTFVKSEVVIERRNTKKFSTRLDHELRIRADMEDQTARALNAVAEDLIKKVQQLNARVEALEPLFKFVEPVPEEVHASLEDYIDPH